MSVWRSGATVVTSAVIVAAGSSRRMGFDKLSVELAGMPVLIRSVLAFQNCEAIDHIVVVTSRERLPEVERRRDELSLSKWHRVVEGDAERHLSVHRGLLAVPEGTGLVAVHDGARPLVTPGAISRCVAAAREHGAVSLAHRVADTLKRADAGPTVVESVSREHLWAMETPQVFALDLLRAAYAAVIDRGDSVTDEVSAVQSVGGAVRLVENSEPNPKITVPADIVLAEALLAARR